MNYDEFRKDALEQYSSLPDETNELYKKYYTEVHLPSEDELKTAKSANKKEEVEKLVSSIEEKTGLKFDLVFSNSTVKNSSELIKIKKIKELGENLANKIYKSSDNKAAAFLNANSEDIIIVDVEKGKKAKLNMLFLNDSHLFFQSFFNLAEGSHLDLFQFYASVPSTASTTAPLQEFSVGKEARLEFTLINDGNSNSSMLNLSKGIIEERGKVNANFVYNGSKLTKALNMFDAKGIESSVEATEMVYGTKEQVFDIHTELLNSKEKSRTKLNTAAVLDGNSQCKLKGYAKIEKWTKGSFSNINQRGIILNEKAHIDALPDMSIDYSDQVSATHSAATSPIDKEILFYMTARGIEELAARKMFVASFISKYLSNIMNPHANEIASSIMLSRIEGADFGDIKNVTPKGIWLTANTQR